MSSCAAFSHVSYRTQLCLYRMQSAHITIVLSDEKLQDHGCAHLVTEMGHRDPMSGFFDTDFDQNYYFYFISKVQLEVYYFLMNKYIIYK